MSTIINGCPTNAVLLAPNTSKSEGTGGAFLINLPPNAHQSTNNNGSTTMVPACVRTSGTSAATVGGRVGNTFVLFPVKQLQRNVVVESSSIHSIIPDVQKPQILSLAVQTQPTAAVSAGVSGNRQQFTPVFLVSSTNPLATNIGTSKIGCGGNFQSSNDEIITDSSQIDMGRNRESLKRKLMQRRPIRELVARGILPAPNVPPSFYEQRLKLERAKMGDILKHKIEHRPNKQQLVSQHILLDSSADPSIVEKLQQLKKCKLADSLNEKLAHRPGPLELVQENILHVDAALEQAVKDGRLQFKPTSAGLIQKHPQPVFAAVQDVNGVVGCGGDFHDNNSVEQISISSSPSSSSVMFATNQQHDNNATTTLQQINSSSTPGLVDGNDKCPPTMECSSPTSDNKMCSSSSSVADCNNISSGGAEINLNRVPIVVENVPSSTKSKPKKSKSKTSPSSSAFGSCSSSSQVAVNSSGSTSSALTSSVVVCSSNNVCNSSGNNNSCGAAAAVVFATTAASNNNNAIVNCGNNNNALPKTKIIKFHEYKGPASSSNLLNGQQKLGLINCGNSTNQQGKLFVIQNGKQGMTVVENCDVKLRQQHGGGLMLNCNSNNVDFATDVGGNNSTTIAAHFDDLNGGKLASSETSYELLLQQQQLMLQWQLELQQKYPNTSVHLMPPVTASSSSSSELNFADVADSQQNFLSQQQLTNMQHLQVQSSYNSRSDSPTQSGFGSMSVQSSPGLNGPLNASSLPQTPAPLIRSESENNAALHCVSKNTNCNNNNNNAKPVEKLEDMKVNDLKLECKKRNLPVSGSKPHLLERLKPYEENILASLKERTTMNCNANLTSNNKSMTMTTTFDDESVKPQSGALPPISFLSSNANLNNLFNSSTTTTTDDIGSTAVYLQTSPSSSSCQSELANGFVTTTNGHSLSVDHSTVASNYSSPGIDLSALTFGNSNNNNGGVVECFTFSSPIFETTPANNNNRNSVIIDQNTIHDQTIVLNGGYNAVLPVHSVVGVTEKQSVAEDANDQRVPILSLHEDMIRGQQRKIDELQRELQRSQDILKQQQQLILAAKKVQAEACEQGVNGTNVSDNILSQLDTKQMQKMHIQLFLQQKLQQQQLQQQLNVQRELVATQQRLEEEMHVHQAVTEVVRLLRQEPRVALLVLHLLKKHQNEQQHQQQLTSDDTSSSNNNNNNAKTISKSSDNRSCSNNNIVAECTPISTSSGCQNSATNANNNVGSVAMNGVTSSSAQSSPKHAAKKHSSSSVNGETSAPVAKTKSGNNASKKSSLQNLNGSNNSSTSATPAPKTPKPPSSAPINMEEIFRTVLEYASKESLKTKNVVADDEMTDAAANNNVFLAENADDTPTPPSTTSLPGCDQIMPQRPAVSSESGDNSGAGVGNLRQLFHFDHNQLPSTTDASSSFIYTKNEAFDDLMEVLRNNGAPNPNGIFATQQQMSTQTVTNQNSIDAQHQQSQQQQVSTTFLNAFSAQDMADLLSSDWFNVDSVLNAGGCVGVNSVCFDVSQPSVSVPTPDSFSFVDKSPQKPESQLRITTPMDSMFSNAVDNSDQMDWLDLILPSPTVDTPASAPCLTSAGGRSNNLAGHTPMETDSITSIDSLITCRRDPLLLSAKSVNSVNSMLTMSGDCL